MLYIFDMGGVVTSTADDIPRVCDVLGISQSEFFSICKNQGRDLFALCSDGTIGTREFWSEFSARSKIKVTTDWWHCFFHPVLNAKTVKIIEALKAAGNRVVCGTNTIESHYLNHVERCDYRFFDQTYASFIIGASKPDTKFWKIILTAENAKPEDCIFIDDKKENCDAAFSLGIKSFNFTTAEKLASELEIQI